MFYHGDDPHYQNSTIKLVVKLTIPPFSLTAPFVLIYHGLQTLYLKLLGSVLSTVVSGTTPIQISPSPGLMPIYQMHLLSHTMMKASSTESAPIHPMLTKSISSSFNYLPYFLQSTMSHPTSLIPPHTF